VRRFRVWGVLRCRNAWGDGWVRAFSSWLITKTGAVWRQLSIDFRWNDFVLCLRFVLWKPSSVSLENSQSTSGRPSGEPTEIVPVALQVGTRRGKLFGGFSCGTRLVDRSWFRQTSIRVWSVTIMTVVTSLF
jgi:hypothetical protein